MDNNTKAKEQVGEDMMSMISEEHKKELASLEQEIRDVFTGSQSRIIKDLLYGYYRLSILQEESSHAYIALSSAVEAFYQELVLNQKLIDEDTFNSIAEKLVGERYTQLQAQIDKFEQNTADGETSPSEQG